MYSELWSWNLLDFIRLYVTSENFLLNFVGLSQSQTFWVYFLFSWLWLHLRLTFRMHKTSRKSLEKSLCNLIKSAQSPRNLQISCLPLAVLRGSPYMNLSLNWSLYLINSTCAAYGFSNIKWNSIWACFAARFGNSEMSWHDTNTIYEASSRLKF